jgi:hypothetical protein
VVEATEPLDRRHVARCAILIDVALRDLPRRHSQSVSL